MGHYSRLATPSAEPWATWWRKAISTRQPRSVPRAASSPVAAPRSSAWSATALASSPPRDVPGDCWPIQKTELAIAQPQGLRYRDGDSRCIIRLDGSRTEILAERAEILRPDVHDVGVPIARTHQRGIDHAAEDGNAD